MNEFCNIFQRSTKSIFGVSKIFEVWSESLGILRESEIVNAFETKLSEIKTSFR